MTDATFEALLQEARSGDRGAVERFFAAYQGYLRGVARRHLSPDLRAQMDSVDVVQSVWVRLLQKLPERARDLDDAGAVRAYLARATRHRAIDKARSVQASRRREREVATLRHGLAAPEPRPSENARARELWERMLAVCPPQHRPVLELKRQGLPLAEIAGRTGLHPSSVRRVLYELARELAIRDATPPAGG